MGNIVARTRLHMRYLILTLICSMVDALVTSRRSILMETSSLATITQLLTVEKLSSQQPFLSLSNGEKIPAIGYSFYKTPSDVERCTQLALEAGVRLFDTATVYGISSDLGLALKQCKRSDIYISHKVSNAEQSVDPKAVKQSIRNEMKKLKIKYLDVCLIHSPLTNSQRRLSTYAAMTDLQNAGTIKNIGLCHYGVQALGTELFTDYLTFLFAPDEIVTNGFPAPQIIQLQLSPFNQHTDIAQWARDHGSTLQCAAWSRLSSLDGPQDQWAVVGDIAKAQQKTKAQVLVRWALQKGYGCVPRSSEIERQAIYENSYNGVSDFSLSDQDMKVLDKLDIGLPAGQIKVTDGYTMEDIVSNTWDPTQMIL